MVRVWLAGAGDPRRQVDVGDRAVLGSQRLGDGGEGATQAVGREDRALADNYSAGDRGAVVAPSREPAWSR